MLKKLTAIFMVLVIAVGMFGVTAEAASLNQIFVYDVPKKPEDFWLTATSSSITLGWKLPVYDPNVEKIGCRVYRYDSDTKKYKKYKELYGSSCTIKCKASTTYKYKISFFAYHSKTKKFLGESPKSNVLTIKTPSASSGKTERLCAYNISSFKTVEVTKNSASFEWKDIYADEYYVYYSTSKNGNYKKCCTTEKGSATVKGLKSGQTYYFVVRPMVRYKGNNYLGGYSSVKQVTVK